MYNNCNQTRLQHSVSLGEAQRLQRVALLYVDHDSPGSPAGDHVVGPAPEISSLHVASIVTISCQVQRAYCLEVIQEIRTSRVELPNPGVEDEWSREIARCTTVWKNSEISARRL